MIRNSFIFLDKIRKTKEESIWYQGIKDWDDFLKADSIRGISRKSKLYYDEQIRKATQALRERNSLFFTNILPSTETWRLYDSFKDDVVFLDIETTGVTKKDQLLMVGLFDGYETKTMLKNINLDIDYLKEHLKRYKLIVTFNGSSFDLPFLRRRYPYLLPDIPHIDLKHLCHKCGLDGGLKKIEKKFEIERNQLMEKFYGGDVYRLWRMALASGDKHYLDLLIEYNEDDVINLKKIADHCVKELKKDHLKL